MRPCAAELLCALPGLPVWLEFILKPIRGQAAREQSFECTRRLPAAMRAPTVAPARLHSYSFSYSFLCARGVCEVSEQTDGERSQPEGGGGFMCVEVLRTYASSATVRQDAGTRDSAATKVEQAQKMVCDSLGEVIGVGHFSWQASCAVLCCAQQHVLCCWFSFCVKPNTITNNANEACILDCYARVGGSKQGQLNAHTRSASRKH